MRIINKKYLLVIILVGILLTCVMVLKPKKEVKLDNVILKQEVNNKTFAMYKEESENNYVKVEENKFPDMYVLNVQRSKCIDNNGNELKDVLSYENDKVTITSSNTTYCYLYFDKSLGEEIKEQSPSGLKTDQIRGAMYRYQGQATDTINNYICFGTSDESTCITNPDKYMYRIIGIEASTGRVKVIKKEALEQTYQWHNIDHEDIEFPKSNIYKEISGNGFLENSTYIPEDWKGKISDNTWIYGDMFSADSLGSSQTGEELYKTETGKKETQWYNWADKDTPDAKSTKVDYESSEHNGETIYYTYEKGKWIATFNGKVSLMYLHDYYYSVSDEANCSSKDVSEKCKTGWMYLSNNDNSALNTYEWTMSRAGYHLTGAFGGFVVDNEGRVTNPALQLFGSVRPVFYINAAETLKDGIGTKDNPFIIETSN